MSYHTIFLNLIVEVTFITIKNAEKLEFTSIGFTTATDFNLALGSPCLSSSTFFFAALAINKVKVRDR